MKTLSEIWKSILRWFGYNTDDVGPGQSMAINFAKDYNDKEGVNLTYVASNKIANIVTTDSQINVTADTSNARADFLSVCANAIWRDKKKLVSRAAGIGKVCIFPYTTDGKSIKYNIIPQSNIIVLNYDGDIATDIAIFSDSTKINTTVYGKFKRYTLINGTHTISKFYVNMTTNSILGDTPPSVTNWVQSEPFSIGNVKRLLFGEINCPVDPRNDDKFYAASITDGCKSIIDDIKSQFKYLVNEYELKKAFIGADELMFQKDKNGKYSLPNSQLFKIMDTGVENFFEVFDPAIRSDPIFTRLKASYEQLENQIGLSRGIFTSPENVGAYNNTSNIKRSIFDTYAFATEFRDNVKHGITDYLYACNVLAEYFAMTPKGVSFDDIHVEISWSNAIIEDSSEEFNQFCEGVSLGVIDKSELRQWITGEDIETAQSKIDEIQGNMPLAE